MSPELSRRDFLAVTATAASTLIASPAMSALSAAPKTIASPFTFCLNTSTIREQKLGIVGEIELAAKVGYDGIEPWIRDLDAYVQAGGSLADLRKRLSDLGLKVESAIGFAAFLHEDENERRKGLEEARRCMDLVQQIGGNRIAAPPVGLTNSTGHDPVALGLRYRALCELGQKMGVYPQLELWGFSQTLHRLGEVAFTGTEAAHPFACYLLDVYHIYKGGSDFGGLGMFRGERMYNFHMNDYPAQPPRETIADKDRVYPGDGVAPLGEILRTLRDVGYRGALSLELFNPTYWAQDAELVARTGLEKMRASVAAALS